MTRPVRCCKIGRRWIVEYHNDDRFVGPAKVYLDTFAEALDIIRKIDAVRR